MVYNIPVKELNIAVMGDEDLLGGLRLAGIRKYYPIADDHDKRENVRKVLEELVKKPDTGIIVMPEGYLGYAEDIVSRVRRRNTATPVIVEVPSKSGTAYQDITGYYETFMKKFLGFNVEL